MVQFGQCLLFPVSKLNHILELYSNFKNGSYLVKPIEIKKYKYSSLSSELESLIKKIID